MKTYRLTPAAQSELDRIWEYTAEMWGRAQARAYIEEIRAALDGLAAGRRISQPASDVRSGYRRIGVGRHVLFFTEGPEVIDVIRILHQQMDIDHQLGD